MRQESDWPQDVCVQIVPNGFTLTWKNGDRETTKRKKEQELLCNRLSGRLNMEKEGEAVVGGR